MFGLGSTAAVAIAGEGLLVVSIVGKGDPYSWIILPYVGILHQGVSWRMVAPAMSAVVGQPLVGEDRAGKYHRRLSMADWYPTVSVSPTWAVPLMVGRPVADEFRSGGDLGARRLQNY